MQAEQVLTEIENHPDSFMIIGREKGQVLANLVKKHQSKSILEVGTNLGYSSILMAMNLPPDGKITTLEIDLKTANRAEENIRKAELDDKITVIVGNALETIKDLKDTFDFVFIDAAKAKYLTYLQLAEDKLEPQSVIVADNVGIFANAMDDYLQYVKNGGRYQSQTVQVGSDAMEISLT